ncbi:high mobility group box domain-containing protein, partial [Phakopsora pachyrhizi]
MPPDIGELKNEVLNTTVRIPSTPLADLKCGVQNNVLPEVFSQLGHNSLYTSQAQPIVEIDRVISSEFGEVAGILHQKLHSDGQPRRPMNAFMIFSRHRRVAIQAIDTSLKNTEVSKRLGQIWNKLPAKDKLHYLELAKSHKDEFQKKFPDYVYRRKLNNTGKRRSSTSQQKMKA